MKKMLVLLVMLLMVGCEAKDTEKPKQIIEEAVKQEQQVEQPKEKVKEKPKKVETKKESKEEPKKEVKQVEKELPKKTEPKKTEKELPKKEVEKEPEPGLIKDGTHLEEEAKKQEELGIIEPEEEYNKEDDEDWIREYGNTDEIDDYSEENECN